MADVWKQEINRLVPGDDAVWARGDAISKLGSRLIKEQGLILNRTLVSGSFYEGGEIERETSEELRELAHQDGLTPKSVFFALTGWDTGRRSETLSMTVWLWFNPGLSTNVDLTIRGADRTVVLGVRERFEAAFKVADARQPDRYVALNFRKSAEPAQAPAVTLPPPTSPRPSTKKGGFWSRNKDTLVVTGIVTVIGGVVVLLIANGLGLPF